jgi:hypothetical protein
VDQILTWADEYYKTHGTWPKVTFRSGYEPVAGAPGETWKGIDQALMLGQRGLPGHSSLGELLSERRTAKPWVTIASILAWADAYFAVHKTWPRASHRDVEAAPGVTWQALDEALRKGRCGLRWRTNLSHLLIEHRGRETRCYRPLLSNAQIVAWADAYHKAHGCWPTPSSGTVAEAPRETWMKLNAALYKGSRGLPKGSSLRRLLAHRTPPTPSPPVT